MQIDGEIFEPYWPLHGTHAGARTAGLNHHIDPPRIMYRDLVFDPRPCVSVPIVAPTTTTRVDRVDGTWIKTAPKRRRAPTTIPTTIKRPLSWEEVKQRCRNLNQQYRLLLLNRARKDAQLRKGS